MKTIIKKQYWNILNVFYKNKNKPIHLREISRIINLKESPLSRHLNILLKEKILTSEIDGNLKKFKIKNKKQIFTIFDNQKFEDLPFIRKSSINFYIKQLKNKPILIILFGSTAKETFKDDSDIDIITVFNKKTNNDDAINYSEAQTGIKINEFQLTYNEFIKEIKMKQDNVIQSGIETGYPIYNHLFFYEVLNEH